jgi:uncharacterized protein (DUF1697 family)
MTRRVAFLRAVNVGKRTVPMAKLKEVVEGLGYADVFTYINSGNVAFTTTGTRDAIEAKIERALEPAFGFEVETFVRTAAELRHIAEATPFPVPSGHTHMVTFFRDRATTAQAKALEDLSNGTDLLVVDGRDVHWRIKGTVMTSLLKPKDWAGTGIGPSTSRNTNALRKLVAKLT